MADVKIIIKTVDESSGGIKTITAQVEGLEKALGTAGKTSAKTTKEMASGAKGAVLRYTELKSQIDIVAGGLQKAGEVFQKAWNAAKQGATLNQIGESFDRLNDSVFKTPDLLDKMSAAARGTIGETQLMEGVLRLTAGTSDSMAQALSAAAPQLIEIAKASNKLNPALGDTAFLYESISTGIKRSSPLILDNLGIVIKVGEANEKYAASIGKTVDQLTAEDKTMALLNATLESGDKLIQQVGGSVDSQLDSFAQLEVQVQSTTNAFKQWLTDGLLPVIEASSGQYGQAAENLIKSNLETSKSIVELIDTGKGLDEAFNVFLGLGPAITGTEDEIRQGIVDLAAEMAGASGSFGEFQSNMEEAFNGRSLNAFDAELKELGLTQEQFFSVQSQVNSQSNKFVNTLEDLSAMGRKAAMGIEEVAQTSEAAAQNLRALEAGADENTSTFEKLVTVLGSTAEAMLYMKAVSQDAGQATDEYEVSAEQVEEAENARAKAHEEATKAAEEAIEQLKELAAASGDYFVAALEAEEGSGFFNEALSDLGENTYYVSNLTQDQKSDLEKLTEAYDKAAENLHDYELGVKGTGMESEKLAEKMAEQQAIMDELGPSIAQLQSAGGEYVTTMTEATINQEAVNQALFDAVDAAGGSALELAALGGALGLYSEDALNAALKSATLQEAINAMAAEFVKPESTMSINDMTTALDDLINRLENPPPPLVIETNIEEATAGLTETDAKLAEKLGVFSEESQGLSDSASDAFGEIASSAETNMPAFQTAVDSAMVGASESANTNMAAVQTAVDTNLAGAVGTAESYVGAFGAVGTNIGQTMASTLLATGGALAQAAAQIVEGALAAAEQAAEIGSPSRVAEWQMLQIIAGYTTEADRSGHQVSDSLSDIINKAFDEASDTAEDKAVDIAQMLSDVMDGVMDKVGGTISTGGKFGRAADFFADMLFPDTSDQIGAIEDRIADAFGGELPDLGKNFDELLGYAQSTGQMGLVKDLKEYRRLQDERNAAEERLLEIQKKQQQLDFLGQQLDLLETIRDAGLDPAVVLDGIQLGLGANVEDLLAATEAAMGAMIEQADSQLGDAQGVAEANFDAMTDGTADSMLEFFNVVAAGFQDVLDMITAKESEFAAAGSNIGTALGTGFSEGVAVGSGGAAGIGMGGGLDRMGNPIPMGATMAEVWAAQLAAAGVNVTDGLNLGGLIGQVQGGVGGKYGLDMIVPAGYPDDSFPVFATSGERVTIETQSQQSKKSGGIRDINVYVTVENGRANPYMTGREIGNGVANRLGLRG